MVEFLTLQDEACRMAAPPEFGLIVGWRTMPADICRQRSCEITRLGLDVGPFGTIDIVASSHPVETGRQC
jgi:hypothetical protein